MQHFGWHVLAFLPEHLGELLTNATIFEAASPTLLRHARKRAVRAPAHVPLLWIALCQLAPRWRSMFLSAPSVRMGPLQPLPNGTDCAQCYSQGKSKPPVNTCTNQRCTRKV